MKVRAKQTIKVGGEYRVPSKPSAVFTWKKAYGDPKPYLAKGIIVQETGPQLVLETDDVPPKGKSGGKKGDGKAKENEGEKGGGELPEDLPGRDALIAAGLGTLSEVQTFFAAEGSAAIDGIDKETEAAIAKYLDTLSA